MTDALSAVDVSSTMGSLPALSAKMGAYGNIDKTAQDFEAMFATQLLQPMFETVDVDKTFGGGHGEEVMRSFMVQEYGKIIAKSGKLGIASQVKTEMLRAQEAARAKGGKMPPATTSQAYANAANQGANHASN